MLLIADISEALATQKQFPVSVKAVQTKEDLSSDLLVFKAKDYAPTIVGENKDKIVEVKFRSCLQPADGNLQLRFRLFQ